MKLRWMASKILNCANLPIVWFCDQTILNFSDDELDIHGFLFNMHLQWCLVLWSNYFGFLWRQNWYSLFSFQSPPMLFGFVIKLFWISLTTKLIFTVFFSICTSNAVWFCDQTILDFSDEIDILCIPICLW